MTTTITPFSLLIDLQYQPQQNKEKERTKLAQLTQIKNVKQHPQSQLVRRLGIDECVSALHLNSNNTMNT